MSSVQSPGVSGPSLSFETGRSFIGRGVTLPDLLVLLWKRRLLLITAILVGVGSGGILALVSTPIYRSEVLLQPVIADSMSGDRFGGLEQLGSLGSLMGLSGNSTDPIQAAIAVLESREFTISFIKDRNLLPVLFASKWDAARKKWRTGKKVPSLLDGYEMFRKRIRSVKLDRSTKLITLAIEWKDPDLAAEWANEMVLRANLQLRKEAMEEATRNISFLRRQLNSEEVTAIREAAARVVETELRRRMMAEAKEQYAFKVLDRAISPERPDRPRLLLLLAVGALMGFATGALGLVVIEASNQRRS